MLINLRQIAEKVGLKRISCRHCRHRTDITPIFFEFIERIIYEISRGNEVNVPGLGTFHAKRRRGVNAMRGGKPFVIPEGIAIKFRVTKLGIQNMNKLYAEVRDYWEERFGL